MSAAGYSATPLPEKLGIREGAVVALVGAPDEFEATLGELPLGAATRRGLRGSFDLVIVFVRTRRELERRFASVARAGVPIWLAWPKQSSGLQTDLGEQAVRDYALARGWVDHKVAAIDATWSGLRFAPRR